jgi:DEAD/DEAH box helicase domain-containing protein
VQDASHRAGFFNARTFRFNLRTAIQKVVQEHGGPAPITDLTRLFLEPWKQACERPEQFVATFLPPDMEWLEQYEHLRREGVLPLIPFCRISYASGWIGRSAANTRTTAGSAVR